MIHYSADLFSEWPAWPHSNLAIAPPSTLARESHRPSPQLLDAHETDADGDQRRTIPRMFRTGSNPS
jgi:hypothetical protein